MLNGDTPLLRRVCCNKGFTLTELLVVTAIMGIVATGISSVFISTQRQTTSSEQVVDVQANLRVATSSLGRDIQNAGFLVRPDSPWEAKGIDEDSSDTNQLTLNTILASGHFARITSVPASGTDPFSVTDGMDEMFSKDDTVRIIRPVTRVEPDDVIYTIWAVDPGKLTLDGVPAGTTIDTTIFSEEDLIIKTRANSTLNQKIEYKLNEDDNALIRTVTWDAEGASTNTQDQIVARNITGLEFDYKPSVADAHTVVVTVTGSTPLDDKDRVIRNSFTVRNY